MLPTASSTIGAPGAASVLAAGSGRGRPRKDPPVNVPSGSKYCFRCHSVLPLASFATDNKTYDSKRADCRACDNAASAARDKHRRALRNMRLAAGLTR